ncbi:MAG: AI-2E family transporter [Candidatus Omnitrophota bacterium]
MRDDQKKIYRKWFVLGALFILSALFLFMINDLIVTTVLAATFSGLMFPLRVRLQRRFKLNGSFATIIVMLLAFFVIIIPLTAFLTVAARQAVQISENMIPYIQQNINQPVREGLGFIEDLPLIRALRPFQFKITEGFSQLLQAAAKQFSRFFSEAAFGALGFVFKLFVGLYAAFFFLRDGDRMLETAKGYIPLTDEEIHGTIDKGILIMRSTIKSLFVIGVIQGALLALGFWFFNIPGPVFWGFIVALAAVIPGIGASMVWIPAVIYLGISGQWAGAAVLTIWGMVPIGLTDNFLRPLIIGRDVHVPEIYILLSILGGLTTFGMAGIILGPVLASVLVSALEIFRRVFK